MAGKKKNKTLLDFYDSMVEEGKVTEKTIIDDFWNYARVPIKQRTDKNSALLLNKIRKHNLKTKEK